MGKKKKKKSHKQHNTPQVAHKQQSHDSESVDKLMNMLKERVESNEAVDSLGKKTIEPVNQELPHNEISMEQGSSNKTIIALIIGLIVGFGSAWLLLNKPDAHKEDKGHDAMEMEEHSDDTNMMDADDEVMEDVMTDVDDSAVLGDSSDAVIVPAGSNTVNIKDQVAGESVFLSLIELTAPGWVAIHEERDGGLGNVLGAAWFDAGVHQGDVELLRATTAGATYYAALYSDNGNKSFEYRIDPPITSLNGELISMSFLAL